MTKRVLSTLFFSLYDDYIEMKIDEKQELFDLSGHNLIEVMFQRKDKGVKLKEMVGWEECEYYRTDEVSLQAYRHHVENSLKDKQDLSLEQLNKVLRDTANVALKRK